MKKKLVVLLAAALTVTMMGSALTVSAAEEEKTVTYGWPYEPSTIDPANASDDASIGIVMLNTEGFFRLADEEVLPGCVETYEVTDDHMEYVFHLREGLTFSDGTPITADTFRYSIERLLDANAAYAQANAAYCIKNAEAYYNGECEVSELGVEVIDDTTLKLTMECPTYPKSFTSSIWSPVDQATAEEADIAYGAEADTVLGNGPFVITDWVHDSEMTLVKNEAYWNADAVNFDKVVIKMNVVGDTAVDLLLAGEVDLANLKTMQQAQMLTDAGFVTDISSTSDECIHINHTGRNEETGLFLGNVNFRKALNIALDREALQAVAYTTDIAASRFVSVAEAGKEGTFHEDYPYEGWPLNGDTEKAQEYLAAALEELGKTPEEIPTFQILCFESGTNMTAMSAVIDMWNKALGISCEIDAQPIQNMLQKMFTGDFDFWKGGISITGVDSLDLFDYYTTASGLFHVNDPEYDALYETAKYATTWEARKDALFELEKYFTDHALDLVITWQGTYTAMDAKLAGTPQGQMMHDVTYADFAE